MKQPANYPENEFTVKESLGVNLAIGIACLLVAAFSIYSQKPARGMLLLILTIFIIAGLYYVAKGIMRRTVFIINSSGIFFSGELVTNWEDFVEARLVEEMKAGRTRDFFYLVLRYHRDSGCITRKILLSNSTNKADEELLAAIRYFFNQSPKRGNTVCHIRRNTAAGQKSG